MPAKRTTAHVAIDLGDAGRLAVVADSHSAPHPRAYDILADEAPVAILHAGDIGRLTVLDELDAIAPTHAVRGNIDGHDPRTPDHLVIDLTSGEAAMRLLLTHIAVHGPRLRKDAAALAKEHQASLVICGHSHVPLIAGDRGLSVFNPGSFGPRRFQLPITLGIIDIEGRQVGLRHLNCETGAPWQPPPQPTPAH